MASEDRTWPRWTRLVLRLAIFAALALAGGLARHEDTSSHANVGPPDGYTARFPLETQMLLHRGVDVYYFHDSVGHITETSVDGEKLVVHVAIDSDSRAQIQAMNPAFQVFRDRKDHSEGWIGVIPKDSAGRPMTPKEAARAFGRGA
jgi:hypothetical protein